MSAVSDAARVELIGDPALVIEHFFRLLEEKDEQISVLKHELAAIREGERLYNEAETRLYCEGDDAK